ncbi:hypothetical protein HPY42_02145 [Coprothermobacteraceae bacterium]|nr:hypothetical protein [Coprothermobacteraceae bacterium]
MPLIDWLTIGLAVYFFVSGFISGASALSTALALAVTLLAKSFVSVTLANMVEGVLARYTTITPDQKLVGILLAYLLFFLAVRIVIHLFLRIVLPGSGIGRLLYAFGSLVINGYAYFYLVSYVMSTSPIQLDTYLSGSITLQILRYLEPVLIPLSAAILKQA